MPILSGAVTFSRFRAELAGGREDLGPRLTKGLQSGAFEPINLQVPEDDRACGFVELESHDATDFAPGSIFFGEYILFGYRVDTVKVQGAQLKAELEKWATAFEKEQGRKPTRGEKVEQKATLRHMLRQRAVPTTKVHDVCWNPATGQVQVWAASRKAVDEVLLAMESALQVKLEPITLPLLATTAAIPESALSPTPELLGALATEASR